LRQQHFQPSLSSIRAFLPKPRSTTSAESPQPAQPSMTTGRSGRGRRSCRCCRACWTSEGPTRGRLAAASTRWTSSSTPRTSTGKAKAVRSIPPTQKGLTLRDFRKISQVLYYCLLEQELTQLAINYSFNSSKLNCTVLKLRWWTRRCASSTSPLCPSVRPQETSLSTATRSSSGSSMLPPPTLTSSSHLTRRLHSRLRGPGRAQGGAVEQVWRH
jgi:hypothetical protein